MAEPWEVDYCTKELGVSKGELRKVIAKVGTSADAVRKERGILGKAHSPWDEAKALQRPLSSSEGTMDGASNSPSSSSRSNSIIFCEGDVVVLSMCCRSRSPTSAQIALQYLLRILTASMALWSPCRIVLAQLSNH